MPDRFQVTKTDEETVLDYIQDESASGKLLGDIQDDLQGNCCAKLNFIFLIYITLQLVFIIGKNNIIFIISAKTRIRSTTNRLRFSRLSTPGIPKLLEMS